MEKIKSGDVVMITRESSVHYGEFRIVSEVSNLSVGTYTIKDLRVLWFDYNEVGVVGRSPLVIVPLYKVE